MRLEHYSPEKLKKEILEIVGRHLDINTHRLFFFGSRVTGKGDKHSDIDIGIEGGQKIPLAVMVAINEYIEKLPTMYKIELVDFEAVPPGFRQVALQKIEPIN